MTDDFLLVIISALSAVMIVLLVQLAISKFQSETDFWSVVRNLMLLIRLSILIGLTVGAFYYSLKVEYDDFHITVAVVFLICGIASFGMAMIDKWVERKQKQEANKPPQTSP